MKFEIHFEHMDGSTDSIVLSGDSVEEIQKQARAEVSKRDPVDYWSERVE